MAEFVSMMQFLIFKLGNYAFNKKNNDGND